MYAWYCVWARWRPAAAPKKEPSGAGTINNDSTKPGDTGYVTPADSANNAKYIQPNSDNPPKPVDH